MNFSPAHFCHSLWQKFRLGAGQVEALHIPNIPVRIPAHVRKLRPQIRRQPLDHGVAPSRRLLLLHNPSPDVPIKHHQFAVYRSPGLEPRGEDPALHLREESGVVNGD